jgi:hypothetical protein
MKKILIASMSALFLVAGAVAYMFTLPAGVKSVIAYNITQDGYIVGSKVRTSNKNWNYSEETTYLEQDSEVFNIQNHVCVAGDGLYKIDHTAGELSFQSRCEPIHRTLAQAQASPDYVTTTTFLGYQVVVETNELITVYFSPDLQAVLKYQIDGGKVIEATNVTVAGVPSVVLPNYTLTSYDDYIAILDQQLADGFISQAAYDAEYNAIPPEFR